MKLTHVIAENFIGTRSANVTFGKPITLFGGANAAGKSSLQEAIRMALTGETVRVSLKKEYGQLVTEGQRSGFVEVGVAGPGGVESSTVLLPSGKVSRTEGFPLPTALPYVLDAQRFSSMDDKARRSFLFGLMGIKITPETVGARLTKDGHDKARVDRVLPLLRAGFESACTEAKSKATEAKGAWRAITGETYGAVKAATWKAPVPATDADALAKAQQRLASIDQQISDENQNIGSLQARLRSQAEQATRITTLRETADRLERIQAKQATDEATLKEWEAKVADAEAKASGAAPAHPLTCPHCQGLVEHASETELRAYVEPDAVRDDEAAAALPKFRSALSLARSAVANNVRDLDNARAAAAQLKELTGADQPAPAKQSDLEDAVTRLAALKTRRSEAAIEAERLKAAAVAVAEASKKTADAAAHHADVAAWDALAAALAPDGIPGRMLAEALEPINDRLEQSSADADWARVGIEADMTITCGPDARPYQLLSESERWRADAMVAEAISFQSGLKLLVLDRIDVLDGKGRADLLLWLDVLATQGEIETALLFGTLKSLPNDLPATVVAEWISNGHVGQLKEAA